MRRARRVPRSLRAAVTVALLGPFFVLSLAHCRRDTASENATGEFARPSDDRSRAPRGELLRQNLLADSLGPLVVSKDNPRYFARARDGRPVYLTGSHTWNTFQDWGVTDPPPAFDYEAWLDFLAERGHNFLRLYVWEQSAGFPGEEARVVIAPLPYRRAGPGLALDGKPRFDLTQFDPAYFRRLRERVVAAGERGIYVSVMLWNGWSVERKGQAAGNPWRGHPLNRENNINGLDGDPNGDGEGRETHSLEIPEVTAIQKRYLREVAVALRGLDNLLWEISNESHAGSAAWQREMIRTLRDHERVLGEEHPIGMTSMWPEPPEGNASLLDSPADWISPHDNARDRYRTDPPPASGRKVVLVDTDHLWGVGGTPGWVWESFTRGMNVIFMDPYETRLRRKLPAWTAGSAGPAVGPLGPEWEGVRRAMGVAREVAERVDLASMEPRGDLASTGYCLAAPGREYLVYLPLRAGRLRRALGRVWTDALRARGAVDLGAVPGDPPGNGQAPRPAGDRENAPVDEKGDGSVEYLVEWIEARSGARHAAAALLPATDGRRVEFRAPFSGDALLHLSRGSTSESRRRPGAADAGPVDRAGE
jgi:hypothetical protein